MTRTPGSGPRKRPWWQHLLIFLSTLVVVAALGTVLFLKGFPSLTYNRFHQQINAGFGTGSKIPDNTLHTFDFIASPDTANGNPLIASGNQDGLYTMGWITGPATIVMPDPQGRYQAVELIEPSTGVVRTLHGPSTTQVDGPLLFIGRTYAADASDVPAALTLARALTLATR